MTDSIYNVPFVCAGNAAQSIVDKLDAVALHKAVDDVGKR
jgi:hypothetical protein